MHIPKTGGTSIEAMVRKSPASVSLQSTRLHGPRNQHFPLSPQHFHTAIVDKLFDKSFFNFELVVVRHPVHRAQSEYRMRAALLRHNRREPPTFSDWLDQSIEAYREDPFYQDNHFRPQVEFVGSRATVFRFEDGLAPVANSVFATLGLDVPQELPHKNGFDETPIQFGQETLDVLAEAYASDFENLGYEIGVPSDYAINPSSD